MSVRDQILAATDDLKSEVVDVPEWGVKLVVREMNVRDRNEYVFSLSERVEGGDGFQYIPINDPLRTTRLVIATTFDGEGNKVFNDDDVDALSQKAAGIIDRLSQTATRLSGLNGEDEVAEAVSDAGKDSSTTIPSGSTSSD